MMMVMAMTITVDILLLRPKLDYDGGYDAAVKGLSIVVPKSIEKERMGHMKVPRY